MMKGVSAIVVLLACWCTSDAWWFRDSSRFSEYPRFPAYSRRTFTSNSGRTTFDLGHYDVDDYFRGWAGLEHRESNWNSSVRGSIDSDGNFGLDAGFSMEFRKRSAKWNGHHYNITLYVDPCNFFTYDYDRNGAIAKEELHAIFGESEKVDALFNDLDTTKDDGGIEIDEFYTLAPLIIAECMEREN